MGSPMVVTVIGTAMFSALIFPIDMLKTHMQMRHEMNPMPHLKWWTYQRRSIKEMRRVIGLLANQNYFRLYRVGMFPMFIIGGFNTWFRVTSYEIAYKNELLFIDHYDKLQLPAILFCGSMGIVSQFAMNPLTLIKTQLQYITLCHGRNDIHFLSRVTSYYIARRLYSKYGWRAFLIGTGACVPRGFVASASQLVFYEQFKIHFDTNFSTDTFNSEYDHVSYVSAIGGGILSTIVTCPFDVIYTRMHTQPYVRQHGLLYDDVRDAFSKILRNEGAIGLFKGLPLLYCKHGVLATVSVIFWDIWKDHLNGLFRKTGSLFQEQLIHERVLQANDLF